MSSILASHTDQPPCTACLCDCLTDFYGGKRHVYFSMIKYTLYSEAGGVGKTTLAANLAVAHARHGRDVLVIDLDPQDAGLSYLLDVDGGRTTNGNTLTHHLIGRQPAPLEDLVRTAEHGVDILPTHDRLGELTERLIEAERTGWIEADTRYQRLHTVLQEAAILDQYDTLIVDPPATAKPHLYNAVYATRSLVLPVELSGKGKQSIAGLDALVDGLEAELDISVTALAAVPVGYQHNVRAHDAYLDALRAGGFRVPVVLWDRTSLFQGCWTEHCSAWTFVDEHRSRRRDREVETLDHLDTLASELEGLA